MSAATFSTGRSAPLATFSNTKSCASARTFAVTVGALGTRRRAGALGVGLTDLAGVAACLRARFFPPLETYFFDFFFGEDAGVTAAAKAAAAIARASSRVVLITWRRSPPQRRRALPDRTPADSIFTA